MLSCITRRRCSSVFLEETDECVCREHCLHGAVGTGLESISQLRLRKNYQDQFTDDAEAMGSVKIEQTNDAFHADAR